MFTLLLHQVLLSPRHEETENWGSNCSRSLKDTTAQERLNLYYIFITGRKGAYMPELHAWKPEDKLLSFHHVNPKDPTQAWHSTFTFISDTLKTKGV